METSRKVIMSFGMSFRPHQGRYMRVYNQATALARSGYEVTLLAWDRECEGPEEDVIEGIRVVRLPVAAPVGSGPANILNILKFNRLVNRYIREHRPDVVHCYNLDTIWTCLAAGRAVGAATVLDLCEPNYFAMWEGARAILLKPINWLERWLSSRYDLLCVHNKYQVEKFERYGHRNLVQIGSYPPAKFEPSATRTFDADSLVIGRVGSIYEDNGIEELLAAFKILKQRREQGITHLDFRLHLAGRVFDSYAETFRSLTQEFGDELSCTGAFPSEAIPEIYGQIDIATVIYRRTKWFRPITPTKLFDALSCGVPIIGTDMGEVREILEGNQAGVIVDETDAEAVADMILELASQPEWRKQMVENGYKASRREYSWGNYEDIFLRKYAELTADT